MRRGASPELRTEARATLGLLLLEKGDRVAAAPHLQSFLEDPVAAQEPARRDAIAKLAGR